MPSGYGNGSARYGCRPCSDCSMSAGEIALGPLALTRAMCPPGSLHDLLVKQWPFVRSYVLRDGHLYLSLMADGGIFEHEPLPR